MASTLEEANDYVVLNMEGLEADEDGGMNIIMINPDEGEEGEGGEDESGEGQNEDEKSQDVGEESERPEDEGMEDSQDSCRSNDIEKEQEEDTEMEMPPSDTETTEAPSGGDEVANPPEDADEQSDDDGVQPLVLGCYDDPDSPSPPRNDDDRPPRPAGDFPILDFSDMDQLDLTGGASSADMDDLSQSAFQPQIISVQSGPQVNFSTFAADRTLRNETVAMFTDKDSEKEKSQDENSRSSSVNRHLGNNKQSVDEESVNSSRNLGSERNSSRLDRLSQDSRVSSADSEPVIILSDDEMDEEIVVQLAEDAEEKDAEGKESEGKDAARVPERDTESTDSAPESTREFTELRAALMNSDDPLVRKIAKKEKLNLEEAKKLAEEVRAYREANNIEISDSPVDETDDDVADTPQHEVFHTTPLSIIEETSKELYMKMKMKGKIRDKKPGYSRYSQPEPGRESPEPVVTYPAPLEEEPDEITGQELKMYKQLIQNPKAAPVTKPRTIRELLYHKEKGILPPGHYFTFDDCLIKQDETRIKKEKAEKEAKVLKVTSRMLQLKEEEEDEIDTPVEKKKEVKQITDKENESKEKESAVKETATKKSVSQPSKPPGNRPLISLSKTNNQEMPPEGGSTIILPDGTTIKMSPQQAFNITSTINVPGSGGDEGYEQEEGECYEVGEEDDLWSTHMTCDDCGELLPLGEVMAHMVSQHWENNPACYKCGTCEAWFFNKEDYHTHMSRVVEKSGDFIKMDKLYKCAVCNKYFKDSEFFLKHLHRKHTDVDSVGSMKLLNEIQERQQLAVNVDMKPVLKPVLKPPVNPIPAAPVIKISNKQTITKTTTINKSPLTTPHSTALRNKNTSMVRDIGVRLGVKNKFKQLADVKKDPVDLKEGTIITAPSSDSSEEEIPGDDAEEPEIKQEEDSKRWMEALSTGPPPKTIAPQPSTNIKVVNPEASSVHSILSTVGSSTPSVHSILSTVGSSTPSVHSILSTVGSSTEAVRSILTSVGSSTDNINSTVPKPATSIVQPIASGVPGAPIIPAAALRPFLNQNRPGGSVVVMMPNAISGQPPRILATSAASLRPGMNVIPRASIGATSLSRMVLPSVSKSILSTTASRSILGTPVSRGIITSSTSRGILNTTASRLGQQIAHRREAAQLAASLESQRKVPLILQKRNSGRKVNPLLNVRHTSSPSPTLVLNQFGNPIPLNSQGTGESTSKEDSRIVNEEGFDIPQFIEYNKPPTPPRSREPRRRGRRPNPNNKEARQKRKRRKRGRPRASSEECSASDDEEFDNWLEQVSEKADKRESKGGRRKVRLVSEESRTEDESDSMSQDSSEVNFPIEQGKSAKRFNCNLCSRKFLYSTSLLNHMKLDHSDELKDTIQDAGDVMMKCQICDHCFDTAEELNFHALTHIDSEPPDHDGQEGSGDYECQYCGEKFEIEDHLNYHVIKHQIAMEEGEEAEDEDVTVD